MRVVAWAVALWTLTAYVVWRCSKPPLVEVDEPENPFDHWQDEYEYGGEG